MTEQEIIDLEAFAKELKEDVATQINKAVMLIQSLKEENRQLRNAYCDLTGNNW